MPISVESSFWFHALSSAAWLMCHLNDLTKSTSAAPYSEPPFTVRYLYPPATKHGLLENPPIYDMMFQKKNIKKRSFVRGFPISMFEYPKEGDKLEHSPSIELSPKPLHLLHKCLGLCQGNQFILLSMQDEGRKQQTPHLTSADNRWFDQRKLVIWPVGFLASNRNGNNGWGSGITPWNHGTNGTHVMTMITVGKSFSKTQRVGGVRECSVTF